MSNDLAGSVQRVLHDLRESPALDFDAGWAAVADLGLPSLMVGEAQGGLGLGWAESYDVLRTLGSEPLSLPIAETMVVARLLSLAGFEPPAGGLGLCLRAEGELQGSHFSGRLNGVAFGTQAAAVLAALDGQVFLLSAGYWQCKASARNPAGESRDLLGAEAAPVTLLPGLRADPLHLAGALMCSIQAAGALQAALALSIAHASERKQFGRSIGQFQAVQQALALFGTEVAAVACATRAAAAAADRGEAGFQIGAAKLRCNLAIAQCTAIAHQVHGAIGFTHEHALRQFTQRLIGWRSDFGNERYWSERLGAAVAQRGPELFWPDLTKRDDPQPSLAV